MILDDGIVYICTLGNTAAPGRMPTEAFTKIRKYWYGERYVGYNRQYAARGVNENIDMMIRIPYDRGVRIGMYAVLGNGEQFRIDNVSQATNFSEYQTDRNSLKYTDLTLSRLEQNYDLNEATNT